MDKVFSRKGEWFCKVNEREFGPWPAKGMAQAGMATEQRRANKRLQRAFNASGANTLSPRKEK